MSIYAAVHQECAKSSNTAWMHATPLKYIVPLDYASRIVMQWDLQLDTPKIKSWAGMGEGSGGAGSWKGLSGP